MTELQVLLGTLQTNGEFREQILSANTMADRTELIAKKGFNCSTEDIRAVLDEFMGNNYSESISMFTLWGNKVKQ